MAIKTPICPMRTKFVKFVWELTRNDVRLMENAAAECSICQFGGMRYPASPPSPQVVAARPQSALVAAPIHPLPRLAHPSGTSETNLLLGLVPTALAQTRCRMAAAISTTGRGKFCVSVMSNFTRTHKDAKNEEFEKFGARVHGLRRGFPRLVAEPGAARLVLRSRGSSWSGGRARGWT